MHKFVYMYARGPLKDRQICCFPTDFVTLEPLNEISHIFGIR